MVPGDSVLVVGVEAGEAFPDLFDLGVGQRPHGWLGTLAVWSAGAGDEAAAGRGDDAHAVGVGHRPGAPEVGDAPFEQCEQESGAGGDDRSQWWVAEPSGFFGGADPVGERFVVSAVHGDEAGVAGGQVVAVMGPPVAQVSHADGQ
jgi:hypothetical protein